jgi:hypothetical protein
VRRTALVRQLDSALGNRRLGWAGIRGEDAEALAALPQFDATYTIINAYTKRPNVEGVAYEDLTGVRVDLETWDIDDHLSEPETVIFRRTLLQMLSTPSALVPYRPSAFLSAIWFARRDRCLNLGLFGGHQAAFEHKPWVETSLARLGVSTIPWIYIADEEQLRAAELLRQGSVMLRRSRTSGGEGIVRVDEPGQVRKHWPYVAESFVSVAPYLADALPLNVGAIVWHDGVTVHYPSVQLIGIPDCVTRPFGYCGNDYAAAKQLDPEVLDRIEASARTIGRWLGAHGYRGTFGVDFLLHNGVPLFTEINPRFQGSTHVSCQLAVEADESCLMTEHVAATLGMDAPPQRRLRDLTVEAEPLAHVVVHWTGDRAARLDPTSLVRAVSADRSFIRAEVLTRPALLTQPGAAVARILQRASLTRTGYALDGLLATAVRQWNVEARSVAEHGSVL